MRNGVFRGREHLFSGLKVTGGQIVVALVHRGNGGINQKQSGDQHLQDNNGLQSRPNGLLFEMDCFHDGILSR